MVTWVFVMAAILAALLLIWGTIEAVQDRDFPTFFIALIVAGLVIASGLGIATRWEDTIRKNNERDSYFKREGVELRSEIEPDQGLWLATKGSDLCLIRWEKKLEKLTVLACEGGDRR